MAPLLSSPIIIPPAVLTPVAALALVLLLLAGLAGVIGLVEAILDFRAKMRARNVLSRKVVDDPELQQLINQKTMPSEAALETASKAISGALVGELSDSDRKRVEEGLHQPNKSNEWRYINMLF